MAGHDPERPTIGVCFYRSHRLTGNTAFVDALCAAIEEAGGNALAVWSYTLRRDADGRVPALELIGDRVDALVVTMLATGGSSAGDAVAAEGGDGVGEAWQEWDASALADLGVAVIQAVSRDVVAGGLAGVRPRASRRSTPPRRSRSPSSTGGCSAASSRSRSATPLGHAGRHLGRALRARPRALRDGLPGWRCARLGCARCRPRSAAWRCC